MPASKLRTAIASSASYFANFGALAASAPFLAILLHDAGLTDSATADWLALLVLTRWIAIPAWTWLADRVRSIPRVLRIVSASAFVVFAPLALGLPARIVVVLLVAFSVFRAPFGPLLDSFALTEQASGDVAFGRLRAWGTAGYTLGALATGALVARVGSVGVVHATLAFLAFAAVTSFALSSSSPAPSSPARAPALLRRPRVLALFAVALFHQVGLAPYDALFAAYLTKLAGGTVAGAAVATGAGAEFVFMLLGASLPTRWGAARLLTIACVGSAIRWAVVGFTSRAAVLVVAQSLHALTFGAFYLAAVAIVDEECPPAQRTLGQGMFAAWAFGIAAAIALAIGGAVERAAGMPGVFRVGAAASTVAAVLAAVMPMGRARSGSRVDVRRMCE